MFIKNQTYTRKDLYKILNVPKDKQGGAWNTGYIKYNSEYYIFSNIGVAGRTGHNYDNHWEGHKLVWFGKSRTKLSQPHIQELISGNFNVYIFARTNADHPFTYFGKAKFSSAEDTSPVKIIWEFSSESLIDVDQAWKVLLRNAISLMRTDGIFESAIHQHEYKIKKVDDTSITILRLSSNKPTTAELTRLIFSSSISKLNQNQGIVRRSELYPMVVLETAMVHLLPFLDWDEDHTNIVTDLTQLFYSNPKTLIIEAKNDDAFSQITRMLRIRRGQNKLRDNLLHLYEGKCCVTDTSIRETLHACHIFPHSEYGNNNTTNALLLRSDIHDLFDSNLIGINPETKEVKISNALANTEYNSLNNKKIKCRIDGKELDFDALKHRWDMFNSKSTKSK